MPPSKYATQINELTKGQERIKTQLESVDAQLKRLEDIPVILGKMSVTLAGLYEGCPYKVNIARGGNNIARVNKLEKEVKLLNNTQHNDRLMTTKSLAKIALVVAAAGMAGANINLSGLLGLFS